MKTLLLEAFHERWKLMESASYAALLSFSRRLGESALRATGIAVALGTLSVARMSGVYNSMRRRRPPES